MISLYTITAACLIGLMVLLIYFWFNNRNKRNEINKIPGPPALPFIGNLHQFKSGHAFYKQMLHLGETYPGIYRYWALSSPVVVIYEARYVEALLSSSTHLDKGPDYDFLHPWLGTGLLTSTAHKWQIRRKMLTPAFHFNILHDFLELFNKEAGILTCKLENRVSDGAFNVFPNIALCALDIICGAAMGKCLQAQSNDSDYVKAVYKMSTMIVKRMHFPGYWNDTLYRLFGPGKEYDENLAILHKFTKEVILERQDTLNAKGTQQNVTNGGTGKDSHESCGKVSSDKPRLAFLDLLLNKRDEQKSLSLEDIQEEVDTFMFEGHDTTASTMAWATYLIGAHAEVQKKVQAELDKVLGPSINQITIDQLRQLKYLECCIKEALRIFPPVYMFGRRISEDLILGEFLIPEGTNVIVQTPCLHRDPKVFPDPEEFKPERFLLDTARLRHPYSYVPFSAGQRNCIGQKFALMEEKVVLAHLFRKFNVKSIQKREDIRPVGGLILRPEKGIFVELAPRFIR